MIRTDKKTIDLLESQQVWARPNEDLSLSMDFGRDMSGADFMFRFEEKDWSFAPASYVKIAEQETDSLFDETNASTGVLVVNIPSTTINGWEDKTIQFKIIVTESASDFIAVDGTITVAEGS